MTQAGDPSKVDAEIRDGRTVTTETTTVYLDAVAGLPDINTISYSVNLTFERLRKVERLIEVTLETQGAPGGQPFNPGDVCRVEIPRTAALNTVGLTICEPGVGYTVSGGTIDAEVTVIGY